MITSPFTKPEILISAIDSEYKKMAMVIEQERDEMKLRYDIFVCKLNISRLQEMLSKCEVPPQT